MESTAGSQVGSWGCCSAFGCSAPHSGNQTPIPTLATLDWAALASCDSAHTSCCLPPQHLTLLHCMAEVTPTGTHLQHHHLHVFPLAPAASRRATPSCSKPSQVHMMAREVRTLQKRRPPRSFGGGSGASAYCSQMHQGRNCGPRHRRPCHHSSWMRSSGCPRAEKATELPRERVTGRGTGRAGGTDLIAPGLGSAPVQQHLLDTVGIRHAKAGGALHSGL